MSNLDKARKLINKTGADALLVTSHENRFYLSGFYGTAGYLLITKESAYLITDSRYTLQAKEQAKDFHVITKAETDFSPIAETAENIKSLLYEDTRMSVFTFSALKDALPKTELLPCGEKISHLRRSKTPAEVKKIKAALSLAESAFLYVLPKLHEGMKECEAAAEIENFMRRGGALKPSFDTICASGMFSAMPHHTASDKEIQKGDFLVMDYGCILDGYCSDITRTVVIGKADARQKEIYETVLKAQAKAEKEIAPDKRAADIDKTARDLIDSAGYGKNFTHSLGHGVGIEIHEFPNLSPKSEAVLGEGDIVTIEPGIYIEDFGGVRIEDMAYIGENRAEILTTLTKELIEI
ncbi:MAG: aminopeptidase P family protein [Clostridia bacterium]|nr:aminopeptidase P family protein [Clostridia bacterium]